MVEPSDVYPDVARFVGAVPDHDHPIELHDRITPRSAAITDQLTRALGEAVIGLWSNLPQDVQVFKEAVASQGEAIKSHFPVSCEIGRSGLRTLLAALAK
jgi:hypothetical protein